jgi:protein-S-isoprenylcysteine O-methyltransferase Ste14
LEIRQGRREKEMSNQEPSQSPPVEKSKVVITVLVRFIFLGAMMLTALFLSAGTLDWWEGWAYFAVSLGSMIVFRFYLISLDPGQVVERMEAPEQENVKAWDRPFVLLLGFLGPLSAWIVAGLDVRFGWSPSLRIEVQIVALVVLLLGILLFNWALITNRFFSSHVRIQSDRSHAVISSGPYRIVRHPGYAGDALAWLAVPFFFSSYWVAIPTVIVLLAYIARIVLEDRALQEELPGYREYAGKVRYRLIPGIW